MNTLQETLAPSITKAASKQTYYTVRFLVDHERVADAYRAYAYFRWVDDTLDDPALPTLAPGASAGEDRARSNLPSN
jgi:phytoene/squalene synthetase